MTIEPSRHLLVLRHAAAASGGHDHRRPLSREGTRMLPAIRHHLHRWDVEVVLCSSADRAVSTLAGVRVALPDQVHIEVDEALYLAGSDTWLAHCQRLPEDLRTALLIGHNPGLEALVHELAPGGDPHDLDARPPAERRVSRTPAAALPPRGLSPGALAELRIAGSWSTLGWGGGELRGLHHPATPG